MSNQFVQKNMIYKAICDCPKVKYIFFEKTTNVYFVCLFHNFFRTSSCRAQQAASNFVNAAKFYRNRNYMYEKKLH